MRTNRGRTHAHGDKDTRHEELERRINKHAAEYAKMKLDEGEKARAASLRYSLLSDSMVFFSTYDSGLGGRRDDEFKDLLVDTLLWCVEKHDPERAPFSHLVRFKFKKERYSRASSKSKAKDTSDTSDEQPSDLMIDHLDEGSYMRYGLYTWDEPWLGDTVTDATDPLTAAIIEFVSLIIDFLEHVPDRSHSERAKLYMKMNFTEWTTYSVKAQPTLEHCRPWVDDQTRIFATVEDGFLTVYMAAHCGNVRELWETELREGYGEIIRLDDPRLTGRRPPAPWKLATSVHRDYLESVGIKVTPAVISQHRARFNELKEQLAK